MKCRSRKHYRVDVLLKRSINVITILVLVWIQIPAGQKSVPQRKKYYQNNRTAVSKTLLVKRSKEYKNTINYFINKHKHDNEKKLRKLNNKIPN